MQRVVIAGTGSAVPERVVTNHELEKLVDTSDEWIVQRTGIRERRFVGPSEANSDLSVPAARRALEMAGIPATDLDGIILCSVTPDTFVPAGSCYVHRDLGAVNATAFDLTAACTGWIYGVHVGRTMIQAGQWRHCVVIGAECLSRILNMTDRNTCVLFGDGAGAVVLSRGDLAPHVPEGSAIVDSCTGTDGTGWDLIVQPAGGARMPASVETVTNHLHALTMRGREVFKFAVKKMAEMVRVCLERNGLTLDDIALIVPHQVNIRILEAVFDALHLPMDRCMVNLDRYGNTSAASVPIALDEAVRAGRIRRGDLVFATAFGSGLTWGWALIRF
ncbi:MAG: 3-oxoacyl-ACP synthase III family protein [Planctomycetota bacterium]